MIEKTTAVLERKIKTVSSEKHNNMSVLEWLGGSTSNMLLATVMFMMAVYVSQALEVTDANRFIIERPLNYTPLQEPGPQVTVVSVKTLLVFFLAVTGAFHVIYAYAGTRATSLRFVEYAITASAMLVIIQLLSFEDNADLILACATLMATTMLFGLIQDGRLRSRAIGTQAFWIGWIPFIVAWFFVVKSFLFTVSLAPDEVPWFVKYIIWGEVALFSCFAIVQYIFIVRESGSAIGAEVSGDKEALLRYAGSYNLLSITAKMFLALMAFFGLKGMSAACTEDWDCDGADKCCNNRCAEVCA